MNTEKIIEYVLELVKYTLPAAFAIAAARMVFKNFLTNEREKDSREMRMKAFSQILPLRIAAYERAILYLERIEPAQIIQRLEPASVSAHVFHQQLLNEINEEYEHNIVQQLYISDAGWGLLKKAKFDIIAVVNQAAANAELIARQKPGRQSTGVDIAEQMLKIYQAKEEYPAELAAKVLKSEIHSFFQ